MLASTSSDGIRLSFKTGDNSGESDVTLPDEVKAVEEDPGETDGEADEEEDSTESVEEEDDDDEEESDVVKKSGFVPIRLEPLIFFNF